MSGKRTMTLNLTEAEMRALELLAKQRTSLKPPCCVRHCGCSSWSTRGWLRGIKCFSRTRARKRNRS